VVTAQAARQIGQSDTLQLQYATSRQRVILTFNTKDFVQLHNLYLSQAEPHSGIIVSDQLQVRILLRRLLNSINAKNSADMQNGLEFLSNWR